MGHWTISEDRCSQNMNVVKAPSMFKIFPFIPRSKNADAILKWIKSMVERSLAPFDVFVNVPYSDSSS
jgi:hypothetical protein